MDRELRELERRARNGDEDAAKRWFAAACRIDDPMMVLISMQVLGAIQHPGLMETLKMIEETNKILRLTDNMWSPVPRL